MSCRFTAMLPAVGLSLDETLAGFFYVCRLSGVKSVPRLYDGSWRELLCEVQQVFGRELSLGSEEKGPFASMHEIRAAEQALPAAAIDIDYIGGRIWLSGPNRRGGDLAQGQSHIFNHMLIRARGISRFLAY